MKSADRVHSTEASVDFRSVALWVAIPHRDWWDRIVLQVWDDSQWLRNFRMRKGTFMELGDLLFPALKRQNTKMRAALTVEKRVVIALWKLATPDSYRSDGNQFGVGKSTVGAAVIQVARAMKDLVISRVVTLGNVQAIVDGFAAMGFPNCGGAIDGTHIPILAPEHQATEYINRKGYFSMLLQPLVDHKGRFTNINVGWPGKVHDARLFSSQDVFHYRLSKCRMVVECAFGRLKARWRSLLTRSDFSEKKIPIVIAACCALHNICESKGETFMAGSEVQHLEAEFAQPESRAITGAQRGAARIRDALREQFEAENQQ
uniref:DDE Tnp4 domain-containing protein n=1 Tax=Chrysemys picta bellii TaxID=8478 RepID=A0A8C3H697_CHRPI